MRKKIITIVLVLILGGLVYAVATNYPKLGVVTAYAAKKMCSCTFIAERSQESIQNEDLGMSPLNLSETVIDKVNKTATSSIFGLKSKTAEFRGKLGCVLVHGEDDYNVQFPATSLSNSVSADLPFPYGNQMINEEVKGVNYEKLEAAADKAFDPDNGMTNLKTGQRGDQLIRVNIEVPKNLKGKERQLLEEYAVTCGDAKNPISKSFLEKAKKYL